ncbi:putative dolichyl-diphosphooligosaccharide--protein glycotransferase [Helianthus annuus]|nr:putative dolichyl-diphosphooligosaccharide--protein glycotransferase [Helianthus annuus]
MREHFQRRTVELTMQAVVLRDYLREPPLTTSVCEIWSQILDLRRGDFGFREREPPERVIKVIKYESVIHEFDPYFNYRVTQVLILRFDFYDLLIW